MRPAGTAGERSDRYKWIALWIVTLGVFMSTLDSSPHVDENIAGPPSTSAQYDASRSTCCGC